MNERRALLLLTLVGLALRVLAARGMAFWDDDLGTLHEASRIASAGDFLTACPCSWHPPLSFLVAKVWAALAGVTGRSGEELLARAPFVLAGTTAVPLAWAVARRLSANGLVVAALTAANPLLLWCDRDVRGYALLVPLALLTVLFWLRAVDDDRPRDWVTFTVFAALAAWDHYNALPLAGALLLAAALERGPRKPLLCGVGLVLLYAAWLPGLRTHLLLDLGPHQARVQLSAPPVPVTAPAFVLFGLVLGHTVLPWNVLVVAPVALAAGVLVVAALRAAHREHCWRAAFLGLALPVAGAALTPMRMPRYHVLYAPLLAVVLAEGARRLGRKGTVTLSVVFLGAAVSDANLLLGREHHFLYPLHPWGEAERVVRERPAPVVGLDAFGPMRQSYVPDLWREPAATDRAVWLLVDEKTPEEAERALVARFAGLGFRVVEDRPLLRDPDHAARARFVGRGNRETPVRLLRLER